MERIYLDHAATTPMHPRVIRAMAAAMEEQFGNPSSIHAFGRKARQILDESRQILADSIGALPGEIIFTSGGTEADNLAILGYAQANKERGSHIISTVTEHHAVLNSVKELERRGFKVSLLPVDEEGRVSLDDLRAALTEETILASIMYGNNEAGTIQPIREIGELLSSHPAAFHTDAVQAYGIEKLDVEDLKVDLMSVSAHKINGPKGLGFLYARNGIKLAPRSFGGEQEWKRRSGTENIPAIAGFGEAVQIAQEEMAGRRELYRLYKDIFIKTLKEQEVPFDINGSLEYGLPHVLNISFPGTNVEAMLVNLDLAGVAVSSGSACTAGSIEPSHVLTAMFGKESERAKNSIRFSFGLGIDEKQIRKAAEHTSRAAKRLAGR